MHSHCYRARNQLISVPPTSNVISASCTYQFPISVTGTYMLFLPRLYIIRILYVVAQASLRSVDKKPPVYTTPPVAACLTFLFAISTCHSYQTWLSRQDNEHHCLFSLSLYPGIPAPSMGSFVFAFATLVAFGPQVEREQIRYPLTSTGEFEVLIAVNPTVVCSRARLTRVISALQGGSCRTVYRGVSFPKLVKRGEQRVPRI